MGKVDILIVAETKIDASFLRMIHNGRRTWLRLRYLVAGI